MGDEVTFKTKVQYVKPEALNLGPATAIVGGTEDCISGNGAKGDTPPNCTNGYFADSGTGCATGISGKT